MNLKDDKFYLPRGCEMKRDIDFYLKVWQPAPAVPTCSPCSRLWKMVIAKWVALDRPATVKDFVIQYICGMACLFILLAGILN